MSSRFRQLKNMDGEKVYIKTKQTTKDLDLGMRTKFRTDNNGDWGNKIEHDI